VIAGEAIVRIDGKRIIVGDDAAPRRVTSASCKLVRIRIRVGHPVVGRAEALEREGGVRPCGRLSFVGAVRPGGACGLGSAAWCWRLPW
jgi:hypothetical protein